MKKGLKSGILSADKSADGRLTVFLVNVIAVLLFKSTKHTIHKMCPLCRKIHKFWKTEASGDIRIFSKHIG